MVSSRTVLNLLKTSVVALGLCACVSPSATKDEARPYANEPFPVRLVERSKFDARYRPARVPNTTGEGPGTIVIDSEQHQLYYVLSDSETLRYGVAVGATGKGWKGRATVGRKAKWPAWYPTDEMRKEAPGIPQLIPPGPANPLGARALYLYQNGQDTLYRIHGTSEPWTIGSDVSSGCIRMVNEDIIALFDMVSIGTRVIVR